MKKNALTLIAGLALLGSIGLSASERDQSTSEQLSVRAQPSVAPHVMTARRPSADAMAGDVDAAAKPAPGMAQLPVFGLQPGAAQCATSDAVPDGGQVCAWAI